MNKRSAVLMALGLTSALAVGGIEEVVRRGNAYLEAGATMLFIDGLTDKALARDAVRRIAVAGAGPAAGEATNGTAATATTPEPIVKTQTRTVTIHRQSGSNGGAVVVDTSNGGGTDDGASHDAFDDHGDDGVEVEDANDDNGIDEADDDHGGGDNSGPSENSGPGSTNSGSGSDDD